MPVVIEPCDPIPSIDAPSFIKQSDLTLNKTECETLFKSVEEFKIASARCFYGDLSVIGHIWIRALTTALVGAKLNLFPTVEARSVQAAKVGAAAVRAAAVRAPAARVCNGGETKPERPPKMRYTELPLYDSPHSVYKDKLEAKSECKRSKDKILHMMILPYVSNARKLAQQHICSAKCKTINSYNKVMCDVQKAKQNCMEQLRDPNNQLYRSGIVVSTATLCCIASGKGHAKRLFWTSFGAATSGMICFPKKTDEIIREVCSYVVEGLAAGYNILMCPPSKEIKLRPRAKCRKELPDELEHKSISVCKDEDKK